MAYRGSVTRLPIGMLGFSGSSNPTQLQAGHFENVEGVSLDGGLLQKEGGAIKLNSVALGAPSVVISGINYSPLANVTRDAVFLGDGTVVKDTGSGTFTISMRGGNDSSTKVLLHMDGTDASTTFTDSNAGGAAHTWTAVGNAQIDTADSVFGGASGLFDGTGDWITTPDHADYVLGSSNWTIDFRFKVAGGDGTLISMCGQNDAGLTAAASSFAIWRNTSNTVTVNVSNGSIFFSLISVSKYTLATFNPGWHHLALVRNGNAVTLYIDGVVEATGTFGPATVPDSASILAVGTRGAAAANGWFGWIDEFRLSVGVARFTAAFTPPLTPYSAPLNVTRDPPPYFMMAGGESAGSPRTLFLFSAVNQVQAVDGDGNTMADITAPPADWSGAGNFPTFGVLHEGRLWGGGNASDPHRMYYSKASDHQDFGAPGGTLAIHPGEGEMLVGGVSFKGLLILFKFPRGIYVVNTADPSPSGWRVERLSKAVGGVNQHTIVPISNDTMYMDAAGNIHLLSATNAFGDVQTSNISHIVDLEQFIRDTVDLPHLKRAVGIWYDAKSQAQFGVPLKGSADNGLRIIVDTSNPQTPVRFLLSRRDTPISMWMRPDVFGVYKPVHGDLVGFIWLMDQLTRDKGGVGYAFSFESANMDLSFVDPRMSTLNKTGDFLEIVFEPQGDWDLTIQVVWDDVPGPPILYSMGGVGAALGGFILGTDLLSTISIRSIRKRIAGSGRRLRLIGTNSGADQNIAISDFFLSFRAMDERVRANA